MPNNQIEEKTHKNEFESPEFEKKPEESLKFIADYLECFQDYFNENEKNLKQLKSKRLKKFSLRSGASLQLLDYMHRIHKISGFEISVMITALILAIRVFNANKEIQRSSYVYKVY